ncbi:MAG: hypothetical protein PHD11_06770 [Bacteroidales bacterium]|nr:hypothetical protein [Bacteroidales bacterium]MDD4671070.1 hypothetical protein [Bacteroidales bacterium]
MIEKYLKEITKMVPSAFREKGDTLYLYGKLSQNDDNEIDSSILLPLVEAINARIVESVSFITNEGLFKTLIECSTPNMLGFDITSVSELDVDTFLKGQCGYVAVVTVNENQENQFVDTMFDKNIDITLLGHITKGSLRVDDKSYGTINEYIN